MNPPTNADILLSIVIPAFNEERRLPPTLIEMIDFLDGRGDTYEIIVVNDGSTDETSAVVHKIQKLCRHIRLIDQPQNYGKGRAVKDGVLAASGAEILMADADGATPIAEILRLERALASGADVAIGSRAMRSAETRIHTSAHRKLFGRIFNGFVNVLVVPDVADTQCGFKLFTNAAAKFIFQRLRSERFSFDVELLHIAKRAGMLISEISVNWNNIPLSKINLVRDSAQMFWDICKFRDWHRDITPEMWRNKIYK